jgi:hypothetical protein
MPRFQTVVRRARFAYSPFTAQEMQGFAQLLADTIRKRILDQTRTSVQRLISSLGKQADTFGKSGVEKLVVQRDQLLQRYAKEPQAIDAITRSYEKMIAVEEKAVRESLAAKAAKDA